MKTTTSSLSEYLSKKSYFKIKMHPIASNHFKIIVKINGVKGLFILDTGASTSFVDKKLKQKYKLNTETSRATFTLTKIINL